MLDIKFVRENPEALDAAMANRQGSWDRERFLDVYKRQVDFRRSVDFHAGLECDGTFTHFATADDPDGWDHQLQCLSLIHI